MMTSATSRYSGSRSAYSSLKRAHGSAVCSSGRLRSCRVRFHSSFDAPRAGRPPCRAARSSSRFAALSTAPPPVASTMSCERGQFLEHRGLARAEARLAFDFEDDRNLDAGALSISWSRVVERLAELRASSLPTDVLPAPIMPTRKMLPGNEAAARDRGLAPCRRARMHGRNSSRNRRVGAGGRLRRGRRPRRRNDCAAGRPRRSLSASYDVSARSALSRMMRGVMKISSSLRSFWLSSFLNRAPDDRNVAEHRHLVDRLAARSACRCRRCPPCRRFPPAPGW